MTVRVANTDDAAAIAVIMNRVIRETIVTFNSVEKTIEEIATAIDAGIPYFVYENAGEIIGYSGYGDFRTGVGYAKTVEYGIAVDPAGQGLGAGRALHQIACDHAKAAGKTTIVACISAGNPQGIAFHKVMGFEQTGYMPAVGHKFGRDHDLVFAQKRL